MNATRDDEADHRVCRLDGSLLWEQNSALARGEAPQVKMTNITVSITRKGQCWKDHNCEAWRPPVCIFQKKNQCSAGYQCPFVHLSKDDRRVPEGKEKETTSKTPTRSVNRRKLVGNSLHDQEVHATVWTVQLRETLSEGQRRTK